MQHIQHKGMKIMEAMIPMGREMRMEESMGMLNMGHTEMNMQGMVLMDRGMHMEHMVDMERMLHMAMAAMINQQMAGKEAGG